MDIIKISEEEFLKHKDDFINENPDYIKLLNKYNEIYKIHKCFSSRIVFNEEYNKNYIKKHGATSTVVINKNKQFHFNHQNKNKSIHRNICGILNKINNSNYSKILQKINDIKTHDNISFIIIETLDLCSKQAFYMNIYMKLIKDIMNFSNENDKKLIIIILNEYVDNSINKITVFLNEVQEIAKNNINYDKFCLQQKEKSVMAATNMILSDVINNFKTNTSYNIYCSHLKEILHKNLFTDDKLTLLIQLMIYTKKYNNFNYEIDVIDYDKKNKRLVFLVEELKNKNY